MKLYLYVQQNQWVVVALLGGVALALLFWLTCQALWRPREEEKREPLIRITGPISFFQWLLTFMPWALVLVITATTLYTITHLLAAAKQLPNW